MDIREALEKASSTLEADAPEPVEVESAPEPVQAEAVEAEPEPAKESRARAEDGTFKKTDKTTKPATPAKEAEGKAQAANGAAPATPEAQGKEAGAVPPPAPASQPAVKAPQSLTPAEREAFAKAPPELQKAFERREREVNRALSESSEDRKFAASVRQSLSPFEGLARANGMDTVRYAGSVMQTAAALHMGSPQQKAAVVASLISNYGIDVDAINAQMTGQAPQPQQAPQQDVNALVERAIQTRLAQATQDRAARAWSEFQASAPEFLEEVQPQMRAVLMAAAEDGRNMTYKEAYDLACRMNPEVFGAMQQRQSAEAVRTPKPVTERARAAASSPRTQPAAPPMAGKAKNIRSAIDAAAEKLGL